MGLFGWIFYIVMGCFFFFIISLVDNKYTITKLQKLIISIILMMIVSGCCFRLGIDYTNDIFLIFVFLMIFDIIYSSYVVESDFFDKQEKNIEYYIILIIIGFIVNQEFINNVTEIFLTGEDLRIILWSLSFLFIYNFFIDKKVLNSETSKNNYMSSQSVLVKFAKFKYKYYEVCPNDDKIVSNIVYALMIYENSKRSKIFRRYDYLMFRLDGNRRKLGIMQVESDKFISDMESISLTYEKVDKLYNKKNTKSTKVSQSKDKVFEVMEKCSDNPEYVKYIFDIIEKF